MKIVLAGSPFIALEAFEVVIKKHNVVAIVTQPDRKKGRGLKVQETDVALLAKKYNIKTFKPEKIISIYKELKALDFDIFISFAFGQYVPTKILALGKYKPVNIHGSLLPKYRGAAPIHWAILNGDKEIGITLIEMIKEMDAGNMFFKAAESITEFTNTGEGFKILSNLAKNNINLWLEKIEQNEVKLIKQPSKYSLAPKIEKSFSKLTNDLNVEAATRKIRGLNPFPGAFMFLENKRLKVFDVSKKKIEHAIELKFIDGVIYAIDFQWEGKKRKKIL